MKRRIKQKSSVYAFLLSKGILENGTDEEIQNARQEYWKEYKRRWRIEKRRKEKEITLSLSHDEWKILNREATRHKLNRTQFFKQASFAYINKSFIVPNTLEVRKIAQLLSMTYNSIQDLLFENKVNINLGRNSLEVIQQIELDILPLLNNPKTIEECIKHHIGKKKENKFELIDLINSL